MSGPDSHFVDKTHTDGLDSSEEEGYDSACSDDDERLITGNEGARLTQIEEGCVGSDSESDDESTTSPTSLPTCSICPLTKVNHKECATGWTNTPPLNAPLMLILTDLQVKYMDRKLRSRRYRNNIQIM